MKLVLSQVGVRSVITDSQKLPSEEGLPGVLGNKGTLAKYRREQGNISQFLGTGEQNSKSYSTKTFGKCVGIWEYWEILEGNEDPPWETLSEVETALFYKSRLI